ncbi:MAG: cytidine deaminase [Janthinobacterium lividum]
MCPSSTLDVQAGPERIDTAGLSGADAELVEAARLVLVRHYRPFWHMVSAALRGRDGRIWTGLHLGATVGRMQVCAEVAALGRAILEGDGTVECAVALRHPKAEEVAGRIAVVPPCGACRELLTDYDPQASVIVPGAGGLRRVPIGVLLPQPYQR